MSNMKTIIKRVSVRLVKESAHMYSDVPLRLVSPQDVAEYANKAIDFDTVPCEMFVVIPVDCKLKPLAVSIVTKGTLNCSLVHPREVFTPCLLANAYGCFVLHNHPSGDTTPSKEDREITRRLVESSHILDMPVFDHVILGDKGCFYSFRSDGTAGRENIKW